MPASVKDLRHLLERVLQCERDESRSHIFYYLKVNGRIIAQTHYSHSRIVMPEYMVCQIYNHEKKYSLIQLAHLRYRFFSATMQHKRQRSQERTYFHDEDRIYA